MATDAPASISLSSTNAPESISLSSDQVYDRHCSVCERKDTIREAVTYCTACADYFCQECLDFHNSLPVLQDHLTKLLGKTTMLNLPLKTWSRFAITTMCEEHCGQLVEMFCQAHNVVCCPVCLAEKHRLCDDVHLQYVPKASVGFSKSGRADTSKTISDLQTLKKELTEMRSSRQKDQIRIQQEKDQALKQIKECRQKIDAIFDELEKSATDRAQQKHQDYGGKIQTDLKECDKAIRKIEEALKRFDEALNKENEVQLFVNTKKGAADAAEFSVLVEQIQDQLGKEVIEITINEEMMQYLAKLEKIGTFADEMNDIEPLVVVGGEDSTVKMDEDNNTCDIQGSCYLPEGGALLSDYTNNKLKRLDTSYRIKDSCKIKRPCGVCYIADRKEAAVGQEAGPVHIVSVGSTMTVIRSIKTDHDCFGVSYNNGHLYVGQNTGNKLHIYDFVSGDRLSTIHTDDQGRDVFSDEINHFAISLDETRMFVADYGKGLLVLDKNGANLKTITDDEIDGAWGVCFGGKNSVLVSGADSRTVLQLSPRGEKVGTLLQKDDLQESPRNLCYDKNREHLLVTMSSCNYVKVFHIK